MQEMQLFINLEDSFGQIPIVLLSDLRFVGRAVEHRRVVIDVVHVNDNRRVILVEIIRSDETKLVLHFH